MSAPLRTRLFVALRSIKGEGLTQEEVDAFDALFDAVGLQASEAAKPERGTFADALAVILRHEGGYVNHPRDPGGRTNLGVTQKVWEQFVGRRVDETEMRSLTPTLVTPLYERNYWKASGADRLPFGLGLAVFDFAVNAGPARAVRYLQSVVGATADGRFGPQTLAEVEKDLRDYGEDELIRKYQAAREGYYRSLPTFATFGKGWLRRNRETTEKALEMAA